MTNTEQQTVFIQTIMAHRVPAYLIETEENGGHFVSELF